MILLYIILQLLYTIDIYNSIESNSFCYTSTKGYVSGVQDCTGGHIFLKGSYIEVGIHTTGSFGTSVTAPSGYTYSGKRLGFISDYDKNGWNVGSGTTSQYGYAGDYFVPGTPLEGKYNIRI
jgi:hypothetical protein